MVQAQAEERYGPRNQNFFYAGHEFINGIPQVWYPGDRQHVVMQLNVAAVGDMDEAIFELAHEVVHLLSPTEKSRPFALHVPNICIIFRRAYAEST